MRRRYARSTATLSASVAIVLILGLAVGVITGRLGKPTPHGVARSAPTDITNPRNNDIGLLTTAGLRCVGNPIGCRTVSLLELDQARQSERLSSIKLPRQFWRLPYDEQELILMNEERVSRRLRPILGVSSSLDGIALAAASVGADPTYGRAADVVGWAANWADGPNSVYQDLAMMYVDGYSGVPGVGNVDCTSIHSPGCWIHRRNILASWRQTRAGARLELGAACVPVTLPSLGPTLQCATLMVDSVMAAPDGFTWRQATRMGA
jgi:hypothetical protein